MPARRGRGEGGIDVLKSGSFRATHNAGVDPLTRKRRRVTETFPTRAEASAWLAAQRGKEHAAATTFGGWLDTWLKLHESAVAAATYATNVNTVERHIRPRLALTPLRKLTPLRVRQWLADLHAAGVSASERHRAGSLLKTILNAAVDNQMMPASPAARLKLPRVERAEVRVLAGDGVYALAHADPRRTAAVLVQVDACLRPGELLGLTVDDYDPATGVLSVRRSVCGITAKLKELKTRESRRSFPLAAATRAALEAHLPTVVGPALFGSRTGRHINPRNWGQRVFRKLAAKAGVPWATAYTLRHTGASLLLSAGVNILVVSRRLGHRDPSMTLRVYGHLLPARQGRPVEVVQGRDAVPHPTGVGRRVHRRPYVRAGGTGPASQLVTTTATRTAAGALAPPPPHGRARTREGGIVRRGRYYQDGLPDLADTGGSGRSSMYGGGFAMCRRSADSTTCLKLSPRCSANRRTASPTSGATWT